jgi:hypothetical protein
VASARRFAPSWLLVRDRDGGVVHLDPAYLGTYFAGYPGRVDFSRWPDPIDGLPEAGLPPATPS